MYSISLLPYEYRMLAHSARRKNILLLYALTFLIALTGVYLLLSENVLEKEKDLNDIIEQNKMVSNQISELINLEEVNRKANVLLNQAVKAYGSNPEWSRLISALGNTVPPTAGLDNVIMNYAGDRGECIIQGTARDHQAVSLWMNQLEAMEGIEKINLNLSTRMEEDPSGFIQFELNLSLLPGEAYQLSLEVSGNE